MTGFVSAGWGLEMRVLVLRLNGPGEVDQKCELMGAKNANQALAIVPRTASPRPPDVIREAESTWAGTEPVTTLSRQRPIRWSRTANSVRLVLPGSVSSWS